MISSKFKSRAGDRFVESNTSTNCFEKKSGGLPSYVEKESECTKKNKMGQRGLRSLALPEEKIQQDCVRALQTDLFCLFLYLFELVHVALFC